MRRTLIGHLNPVIDRVAQQMHNRVFKRVQHGFIDFNRCAGDFHVNRFVHIARKIAHDALKTADERLKSHQTHPADVVLQLIGQHGQAQIVLAKRL